MMTTENGFSRRACRYFNFQSLSFAAVSLSLVVVGCAQPNDSHETSVAVAGDTQKPQTKISAYLYQYPPMPPVMGSADFRNFVNQFQNRVVILDFWASWSPRSRDGLSMLADLQAEMHSALGNKQFQVISCNFDSANEWTVRTVPMLQAAGANYPCVLISKDQRDAIREWLAPEWRYELPARFLIDRTGGVVVRAFNTTPLEQFVADARKLAMGPGTLAYNRPSSPSKLAVATPVNHSAPVSIRAKLINISTGEVMPLPEADASASNPEALSEAIASSIAGRLKGEKAQRIAIAPFPNSQNRTSPGSFGMETARKLEQALRSQGYYDLISPFRTSQLLEGSGVTPVAIDSNPDLIRQRLGADYLVLGWIRGDVDRDMPRTAIAVDDSGNSPE